MNHSAQFLSFCGFFICEMIILLGIYIGAQLRNFHIIDIGMGVAVIGLISYTAAAAAIEMNAQDKEKTDNGQGREC